MSMIFKVIKTLYIFLKIAKNIVTCTWIRVLSISLFFLLILNLSNIAFSNENKEQIDFIGNLTQKIINIREANRLNIKSKNTSLNKIDTSLYSTKEISVSKIYKEKRKKRNQGYNNIDIFNIDLFKNLHNNHVLSKLEILSKLERVLFRLGIKSAIVIRTEEGERKEIEITERERQLSFISFLQALGAFNSKVVANGLYKIKEKYGYLKINHIYALEHFNTVMRKSLEEKKKRGNANAQVEYILNELFNSREFTEEDVMEIILYLTNWMYYYYKYNNYGEKVKGKLLKKIIIESRNLCLTDPVYPKDINKENSQKILFITGGSRSEIIYKLKFLKSLCQEGNCEEDLSKRYKLIVTSHECRRLSCGQDGLNPYSLTNMSECLNYISKTARRNKIRPEGMDLFIVNSKNSFNKKAESLIFNDNGELNEFIMLSDIFDRIIGENIEYLHSGVMCKKLHRQHNYGRFNELDAKYTIDLLLKHQDVKVLEVLTNQPYAATDVNIFKNLIKNIHSKEDIEVHPLTGGIDMQNFSGYTIELMMNGLRGIIYENFISSNDDIINNQRAEEIFQIAIDYVIK